MNEVENYIFLNGKEVIFIGIGVFQIQIGFDGNTKISAECAVEFRIDGLERKWIPGDISTAKDLNFLLQKKIEGVSLTGNRDLEISFSNGDYIILLTNRDGTESFQVANKDSLIIV